MAARKELWYQQDDSATAGNLLAAQALKYKQSWGGRKSRATALLAIYEGLDIGRFDAASYDSATAIEYREQVEGSDEELKYELVHNLGNSIMDAIDAKIFALDRHKSTFVVSDGGWAAKRAAVLGGRFCEGQKTEQQGVFRDLWAAWRHGARLTINATTACAMFFWSDPDEGKIVAELDDTLNMFVETSGLPYDGYSSIGRITYWDPEKLANKFPDHKDQIYACAEKVDTLLQWAEHEGDGDNDLEPDRVPLIQAWRMKQGGGSEEGGCDGRYLACLPTGVVLNPDEEDQEYDYHEPPCVIFIPYRSLAGKWGRTILERIAKPLQHMNQIICAVDDAVSRTPKQNFYHDPTTTDPAVIENMKNTNAIACTGPRDRWPIAETPAPYHPLLLDWIKFHRDACFDLAGMSEAQTTASREKGLSSGVAIRLVQNQTYERLAPLEDEFARCVGPETDKQIIRCAKEIAKSAGGFKSTWKGGEKGGFLREIDSDVFNILEKYKYKIEAEPTSGSQNTPADRVQLAEELMQAGIITGEAYANILQTFDTYGETGSELTQTEERFLFKQIDCWLYDELEDAERRFMAPEIWMNRTGGMTLKTGAAFLQFLMDTIDDKTDQEVLKRQEFFRRFLAQLQENDVKRQKQAAEIQAIANGNAQQPAQAPAPGPAMAA